jgi:Predicted membrane protein (DUF2207)
MPTTGSLTHAQLLWLVAVAAAFAVWFAAFWLVLLATRPREPAADPPSQELGGEEPPAVVSLLANHWSLTEDAAESTLVDLAARGFLELRQPAADPMQTTVQVLTGAHASAGAAAASSPGPATSARRAAPSELTRYERRVLDYVQQVAVGNVVPLTALTFRDPAAAARWTSAMHSEVIADARARGLSRRRLSGGMIGALSLVALVPSLVGAAAVAVGASGGGAPAVFAAIVVYAVLTGHAARPRGERPTDTGLAAARRWLGLRAYLRTDEAFGALPPSAVAVWDRYLAYGDALGVMHVVSHVIDLGLGDRKRVWSSYGNTWHQVRVHYPPRLRRYGASGWQLGRDAVLVGAAGYALLHWRPQILNALDQLLPAGRHGIADRLTVVVGVVLLVTGCYRLLRTIVDLLTPVTVTGQVLWLQPRASSRSGQSAGATVYDLAIDDGGGSRTTAWGLPAQLSRSAYPGDLVEVRARRWSRRVRTVTVKESHHVAAQVEAAGPSMAGLRAGMLGSGPPVPSLTPDEVGGILGVPVLQTYPIGAGNASVSANAYRLGEGQRGVVVLAASGMPAQMMDQATRAMGAGGGAPRPLPGIGDEASAGEGWVAARRGDTIVRVMERGVDAQVTPDRLEALLRAALDRATGQSAPPTVARQGEHDRGQAGPVPGLPVMPSVGGVPAGQPPVPDQGA